MKKGHLSLIAVVAIAALVTFFATACASSTTTTAGPATTAGPVTTAGVATTTAGAAVDAAALYTKLCAGCHKQVPRAPGGVDLVKGVITLGKGNMPPFSDTITVGQISALAAWVANGGK